MADINVSDLVKKMLEAAEGVLKEKWPDAKTYAESEFKKIGESIVFIQKEYIADHMSEERAAMHLEIQKNACRMVLLALEGLGILAVEEAINAALAIIKETVNSSLDFVLL